MIEWEDEKPIGAGHSRANWVLEFLEPARQARGEFIEIRRFPADKEKSARSWKSGIRTGRETRRLNTRDRFDARVGRDDQTGEWVLAIKHIRSEAKITNIQKGA